jgi:hypothetical protein
VARGTRFGFRGDGDILVIWAMGTELGDETEVRGILLALPRLSILGYISISLFYVSGLIFLFLFIKIDPIRVFRSII